MNGEEFVGSETGYLVTTVFTEGGGIWGCCMVGDVHIVCVVGKLLNGGRVLVFMNVAYHISTKREKRMGCFAIGMGILWQNCYIVQSL